MYNEKLVVCVKSNGKVLREFKDKVYLPYGSEYSVFLKNLNSVRALVHIYIDGVDVIDGGLILDAGKETNIERYVRNGNLDQGNRFKFIERTDRIEQNRGIGTEDGLLRVEFQFEAPKPAWMSELPKKWEDPGYPTWPYPRNPIIFGSSTGDYYPLGGNTISGVSNTDSGKYYGAVGAIGGAANTSSTYSSDVPTKSVMRGTAQTMMNQSVGTCSVPSFNDAGITVPGSVSDQKFTLGTIGRLDATKHVIVLRLLGEDPNDKPVRQPVTVKQKPKCTTCGRVNKATSKFCVECGTSLEIV